MGKLNIGWDSKDFRWGFLKSGVTPGAVRSGVIPPPKTNPLHAPEDRQHGALPDKLKEVCGYRKIV